MSIEWEDVHLRVCKDDQYKGVGEKCISYKGVIYRPEETHQPDGISDRDIALAEKYLSELCATGGKSWCLSIPVQQNDIDLVFQRLINHAKSTKRESGELVDCDIAACNCGGQHRRSE